MTPQEHYEQAEALLTEGVDIVNTIAMLADARAMEHANERTDRARDVTQRMDELGKKAMGIWAQAQVHATLATLPFHQADVVMAGER